jgi:glycosyltransferase involved in cell wall biosynthesis
MRILFLSDNFPPESNAPATRLYEHAVRWVAAGHDVTVITCAPNFPEGKVFPGYRNEWRQVDLVDGIRVVRVKTYVTANEGFLKRSLDYMSFMFMACLMGAFERRPDIVVATSPQFFCAAGGWVLSLLKRRPFVFELRDLWPASIVAVGAMQKSFFVRMLEKFELFLYRRADVIVSVTRSFRDDLVGRGISADKIHVVVNGVDLDRYAPRPRDESASEEFEVSGKFVVGYIGTHGMAHALPKVLEAAEMLLAHEDIVFLFAGSGAERARVARIVEEKGLHNVRLVPRQAKERMPHIWSLCDLTLVPLLDTPVFSTVIPSKMFEAMGMGVPIVMSLPEGEATAILRECSAGVCVPPEAPVPMAEAVLRLARSPGAVQDMRANAIAAARLFSRERLAGEMLKILEAASRSATGP